MNKLRLVSLMEVAGAALVIGGATWFHPALGMVAGGVALILAGQWVENGAEQGSE